METHLNKKKEDWQKLQNGEKSLITTETKNSDGQNPKDKKQDHKSRENRKNSNRRRRKSMGIWTLQDKEQKSRRKMKVMIVCTRTWTSERLMSVTDAKGF